MTSKHLLIPVAALALMAGASTVNAQALRSAGLTEDQAAAFEVARDLQNDGDRNQARDVLAEAGFDLEVLEEVRNVVANENN